MNMRLAGGWLALTLKASVRTSDSRCTVGIKRDAQAGLWRGLVLWRTNRVAMAGYGRPIDTLTPSHRFRRTPLVLGHIAYPYDVKQRTAPTYLSAATLLRRAADSTGGILMYSLETLDSRTFNSVAAVSKIMAEYEEFFLTGDRRGDEMSVPGWERDDYEVLVDPSGNRLLLLMNTGKTVRNTGTMRFRRRRVAIRL